MFRVPQTACASGVHCWRHHGLVAEIVILVVFADAALVVLTVEIVAVATVVIVAVVMIFLSV